LNKEQLKNSKAYRVLQLMRPIFHEEKQLTYSNHKKKLVQRRLYVKPLMDKFYAYLENINFPQGRLRAAINNTLKLKTET
ncbi:transposase, partial [Limosilactobacillus reuteri]|uniref:IS66 family transposase n=1 Tax=Limosilactobacillus reuteri TaxID=1598 RepID=UPI001E5AA346